MGSAPWHLSTNLSALTSWYFVGRKFCFYSQRSLETIKGATLRWFVQNLPFEFDHTSRYTLLYECTLHSRLCPIYIAVEFRDSSLGQKKLQGKFLPVSEHKACGSEKWIPTSSLSLLLKIAFHLIARTGRCQATQRNWSQILHLVSLRSHQMR